MVHFTQKSRVLLSLGKLNIVAALVSWVGWVKLISSCPLLAVSIILCCLTEDQLHLFVACLVLVRLLNCLLCTVILWSVLKGGLGVFERSFCQYCRRWIGGIWDVSGSNFNAGGMPFSSSEPILLCTFLKALTIYSFLLYVLHISSTKL